MTPTKTTTLNATYAPDDRLLCMSDGTTRTTFTYTSRGSLASKVEMTTSDDCAVHLPCTHNDCAETTYDYDAMGNLTAVVLPDESHTRIEYKSDAAGRRVEKKVNGTVVKRWLWDGQLRPIAELGPDGSVTSLFVYADGVNSPEYMVRDGEDYTFVKDALGSVRRVLDSDGNVVQAIDYDAWGFPTVDGGESDFQQPFGFAGGLWDADTGLVRFGARDYDAKVGRWTAKDPLMLMAGTNVYEYCEGDPLNRIDPEGTDWRDWNLTPAAAFLAGYADGITFGGTRKIREWQEVSDVISECSGWYSAGEFSADLWWTGVGAGGARLARLGKEIKFGKNLRIAPFGNRTGHPLGKWPHYHRRSVTKSGATRKGQGISRHRPWETRGSDANWRSRF